MKHTSLYSKMAALSCLPLASAAKAAENANDSQTMGSGIIGGLLANTVGKDPFALMLLMGRALLAGIVLAAWWSFKFAVTAIVCESVCLKLRLRAVPLLTILKAELASNFLMIIINTLLITILWILLGELAIIYFLTKYFSAQASALLVAGIVFFISFVLSGWIKYGINSHFFASHASEKAIYQATWFANTILYVMVATVELLKFYRPI